MVVLTNASAMSVEVWTYTHFVFTLMHSCVSEYGMFGILERKYSTYSQHYVIYPGYLWQQKW